MDFESYEKTAVKLKAVSHPIRLCILNGLLKDKCNVKHICERIGISQPVVSLHLSKLRAAGIVKGERQGNRVCYTVVDDDIINVVKMLFSK